MNRYRKQVILTYYRDSNKLEIFDYTYKCKEEGAWSENIDKDKKVTFYIKICGI